MKTFTWNEDTLEYFRELKEQETLTELKKEIYRFIYHCHLEGDETYDDLAQDLFRQILKQ